MTLSETLNVARAFLEETKRRTCVERASAGLQKRKSKFRVSAGERESAREREVYYNIPSNLSC